MVEELTRRIGTLDRTVLNEQIAKAIVNGPTDKNWRKQSENPEAWSRAILNLSRIAGLVVDRKETVTYTPKLAEVVDELKIRFGEDGARVLLKAAGVEGEMPPAPIEGETIN